MPKTAKPMSTEEIQQMRQADASIWQTCDPSYINILNRLICDVSEDSIPEPLKGTILLKIRQIYRDLEPYSY